jgi:hypothetical protein
VRQGASWTADHRQLTVAAVAGPSLAAWVPSESLLSGPGCCSPRRRLPGGASSRYREVGRRRRGRHCQQARHGVGRRCPACGVHPSGLSVRGSGCPAVRCPVTWGRRPEGPAVGRPLSTRPVSSRLVSAPSVRTVRILPPQEVADDRDHRNGWRPGGCRAVDGSIDGRGGRDGATLPTSRWSVGGRWRTRAAGFGAGRGGRACPLSDQAGQAGVRSPSRRLRCGHGSRLRHEVAAAA